MKTFEIDDILKVLMPLAAVPAAWILGTYVAESSARLYPAMALIGGMIVVGLSRKVSELYLMALVSVLIGYALMGRGFAYFGLHPLYIGEIVLALAVGTIVLGRKVTTVITTQHVLLGLFMVWGFLGLARYYRIYGFDALRDSVIWAYPLIGIAVSFVLTRKLVASAVSAYAKLVVPLLILAPLCVIASTAFGHLSPTWPGSGVPIINYKGGDMAVHIAGVAGFILVGLYAAFRSSSRLPIAFIWVLWSIGLALSLSGRSALMTVFTTGVVAVLFMRSLPTSYPDHRRRLSAPRGQLLPLLLVLLFLGSTALVLQPSVEFGSRTISANQAVDNLLSIFFSESDAPGGLQHTREWRLRWWGEIVDYSVFGEYRWTGKGFGRNLASEDGFQVVDGSLRSPHSIHFTVLARMGIPGLVLWLAVQGYWLYSMLRAFTTARRRGNLFWSQVNAWIILYWLAFMINASFDVFLEGPQGGIWFWALFGFGMAAVRIQAAEFQAPLKAHVHNLALGAHANPARP